MKINIFLTVTLSLMVNPCWALDAKQVVNSSLKHYPEVIQAISQVEESIQRVRESRGSFDAKFKGEMDTRTHGFYSGDAYKVTVEKPFPFLNGKVYGGKRQSYGSFPSYEGKVQTLEEGEYFAGVSLSLLRDSLIDTNRYLIRLRREDQRQSELALNLMKINVQTMALQAYWMWLIKGHELKVYQDILGLALTRGKQISKRIKAGDLARIYQTENNQYIRKREAQVLRSQMEFQEASNYLSLFFRDGRGIPQRVSFEQLPPMGYPSLTTIQDSFYILERAKKNNIDLQTLASMKKQAELEVSLGRNNILPKVNINYEWNQDQGTLAGDARNFNENRIMLQVEVPIEYHKGLGKKRAAEAKRDQINSKEKLTREKLNIEVKNLLIKLNSFAEIFTKTNEQVKLADKLANAERRKFSQGASDLILVNIREENFAEARVKNLATLLKYYFVDSDLKRITLDFL